MPDDTDPTDFRTRSLAELEGMDVPPGAYGLGSLAWLSRALVSPLGQLGPAELRLLMAHGRGLRWLLPIVLDRLEREPFVAADRGPGDLLVAALTVDPAEWRRDPDALVRLGAVVEGARVNAAWLPDPFGARLRDDLEAAREQFGV